MIKVHRLNSKEIVINCELIESIEAMPDTTIAFTNSKIMIVQESVGEVVAKIVEYKKNIMYKSL